MPLTKLARRYHIKKRPNGDLVASNNDDAKKVLNFESPIPNVCGDGFLASGITVRKKKRDKRPPRPSLDSLQSTIIDVGNFAVSDCKGWQRLESTHLDHLTEALAHVDLSVWTEDISSIKHNDRDTLEDDQSFVTALDTSQKHIVLAEDSDSEVVILSNSSINLQTPILARTNKHFLSKQPLSSSRVCNWVATSPFHSPSSVKSTPVYIVSNSVIEESDLGSSDQIESRGTSKNYNLSKVVENVPSYASRRNIFGNRISLSSPDDSVEIGVPVQEIIEVEEDDDDKSEHSINGIWNIDVEENVSRPAFAPEDSVASRSVSLQVSLNSEDNDSQRLCIDESKSPQKTSESRSVNLQVSFNSDDEAVSRTVYESEAVSPSPPPSSISTSVTLQGSLHREDSQRSIYEKEAFTRTYSTQSSVDSRSVSLQVSFNSDDGEALSRSAASPLLQISVDSRRSVSRSPSKVAISKGHSQQFVVSRAVNVQVSFNDSLPSLGSPTTSPPDAASRSPKAKRNIFGNRISLSSGTEDSPMLGLRPVEAINTLSDLNATRNSKGNVLFLSSDSEDNEADSCLSFLTSLSLEVPNDECHPEAVKFIRHYKKFKDELLAKLFKTFNALAFDNVLPEDMPVVWNPRLTKSAGVCVQRRIRINTQCSNNDEDQRLSKIELSSKILDSSDRLRDTLIHEMCHAAAWIRSGVRDGHGQFWKAWSSKAMAAFPELPIIARCHSYAIRTKYTYVCDKCGQRVGRHSKSLDTAKKVCAYCGGKFKLMMPNGSSVRTPNNFASFVQEHYKSLRTPGTSHAYAMKLLSKKFAETKLLH